MNNIPPIVRSVKEEVQEVCLSKLDAFQLDSQLENAVQSRSENLLIMGEILFALNESGDYSKLDSGFKTIHEYVKKRLDRSSSWTEMMLRVTKKFRVELGIAREELAPISTGKLNIVTALTDEENVDEILEKCRNSTQQELAEYVKEQNGDPELTESDEKQVELRVKGSETNLAAIMVALQTGREEYASNYANVNPEDVSDYHSLEIICANYTTSRSLNYDTDESIQLKFDELSRVYNLEPIEWRRNVN